jgi:hypothetical protein
MTKGQYYNVHENKNSAQNLIFRILAKVARLATPHPTANPSTVKKPPPCTAPQSVL